MVVAAAPGGGAAVVSGRRTTVVTCVTSGSTAVPPMAPCVPVVWVWPAMSASRAVTRAARVVRAVARAYLASLSALV